MSKVIGIVEWYNDDKGFGRLRTFSDGEAFIHFEELMNEDHGSLLKIGSIVECVTETDDRGLVYAKEVSIPKVIENHCILFSEDQFWEYMNDETDIAFYFADVYVSFVEKFKANSTYKKLSHMLKDKVLLELFWASAFVEICKADQFGYVNDYDYDEWADHIIEEILGSLGS